MTFIETNLSASSKIIILCRPFGKVTFCWANILILLRTTSIPLQQCQKKICKHYNTLWIKDDFKIDDLLLMTNLC